MSFPANRLREAGASDEEINQLAAEHDQQPQAEKDNLLHKLAEIAKGDIVGWLQQLRETGHFGDAPGGSEEANDPQSSDGEKGDGLSHLTRDALNDLAKEHGIEDPDKLANKQAVIDAITAEGHTEGEAAKPVDDAPAPE